MREHNCYIDEEDEANSKDAARGRKTKTPEHDHDRDFREWIRQYGGVNVLAKAVEAEDGDISVELEGRVAPSADSEQTKLSNVTL